MPTVGKRFVLSNRFLPVADEADRKQVITSPVVWAQIEQTHAIEPDGSFQRIIDFRTKFSEYRLTWLTR
jgi:hypothetical protein